jgi:hypothetical protein
MDIKTFLKRKLSEGSTWGGIGALIVAYHLPHADELSKLMPTIGLVVSGLLAIYFPG